MHQDLHIPDHLFGQVWHYKDRRDPMAWMHHHREIEGNIVVRGRASYRIFDRRVDLHSHTLIWLFPKQEHILFNTTPDFEMWIWVIKPEVLKRNLSSEAAHALCRGNPPELYCRTLSSARSRQLAGLMRAAHDVKSTAPDVFNTALLHATTWAWSEQGAAAVPPGPGLHPAVDEASQLLAHEEIELALVAKRVGQHPAYLSKLFHQQMGIKLVDYRNRMRIQRFLNIYDGGDSTNMMAAAFAAGFGSYAQFHRIFVQIMGTSPSAYHKRRAGK